MKDWREQLRQEWEKRVATQASSVPFPLTSSSANADEVIAATETLLSGRWTMGERVAEFEAEFAKTVGAPHAVMVNSGSSANLLALAVAANPQRRQHLNAGDEVLVPAICWSTSVWPILQLGLVPVFVDVDPRTLNLDLADLRRKCTARSRALMLVHTLGNSAPMMELLEFVKQHKLILIEDTCEALGSSAGNQALGTFGDFGTYSFYYSHHITTGEGGMVVCRNREDYDLLQCLRAHGWSRPLSNRSELERAHPQVDPRWLFVNVGYNFRPMEIQAAIGLCQLRRLKQMNDTRRHNRERLQSALQRHPRWQNQFEFPMAAAGTEPAWFGFACLLSAALAAHLQPFLAYLTVNGVEHRPIISGNFTRQPALRLFGIECDPTSFPGAETVNARGFFVGLHGEPLPQPMIDRLADILLRYEFR